MLIEDIRLGHFYYCKSAQHPGIMKVTGTNVLSDATSSLVSGEILQDNTTIYAAPSYDMQRCIDPADLTHEILLEEVKHIIGKKMYKIAETLFGFLMG